MTLSELLTTLNGSGVRLGPGTNPGTLQIDAPEGVITSVIREELACHKSELLALLRPEPDLTKTSKAVTSDQASANTTSVFSDSENETLGGVRLAC